MRRDLKWLPLFFDEMDKFETIPVENVKVQAAWFL